MQLVDVFRARVVDVSPESLIIEITGTEDKIDGLVEMLRPYGVLEMARTGRVAMSRGNSVPALPAGERRPRQQRVEFDSGVSFPYSAAADSRRSWRFVGAADFTEGRG